MKKIIVIFFIATIAISCNKKAGQSSSTGWDYNSAEWGGFLKVTSKNQPIGPNLVPIEGGTFIMGMVEEDVMFDYNNMQKKATVNSFLMDETEVSNIHYREYVYWVDRVIGDTYPDVVEQVRPDTLVWREELAYNEPQVENYFSFPAYNDYPVVGVSWEQANDFAQWRSDRVNEMFLARKGVIEIDLDQNASSNFNTDAYLIGKYKPTDGGKPLPALRPDKEGENRIASKADGIILPNYRLPTEAEWEYAALGMIGNLIEGSEINKEKRLYPWDGKTVRASKGKDRGKIMANFKRGRGDNMGVAGALNDNAAYTANVYSYAPNAFGLFNMAGNVSEWVQDVYRPLSPMDMEDFSPFRGNVFERKIKDENGDYVLDSLGRVETRQETIEDNENRRNYQVGDARNYRDGDELSDATYGYGVTTLINDKARVYKGGSWNDRAFFLTPGSRRFYQQDQASKEIGFRCAQDMIGGPEGNVIRGKETRKQRRIVKKNRKARAKSMKGAGKGGKKSKSSKKSKKSKKSSSDTGNSENNSISVQ